MIVELDVESQVLQHALGVAEGVQAEVEELDLAGAVPMRNLFWAHGGDLDGFEAAIEEDPTVTDATVLADAGGRRLYGVEYPEDLDDIAVYQAAVELGGGFLGARSSGDGWDLRMSFPDGDALRSFLEACEDNGLPAEPRSIYSRDPGDTEVEEGLTAEQREAIVTAARLGYFEVPREAALTDVADELGISQQAASERLRRGLGRLVEGIFLDDSR